jgi:hypothetical protein
MLSDPKLSDEAVAELVRHVAQLDDAQRIEWLHMLAGAEGESLAEAESVMETILRATTRTVLAAACDEEHLADWTESIDRLYRRLAPANSCRYWLLLLLNRGNSPAELEALTELITDDPPEDPDAVAAVVARLIYSPPEDPSPLFPRLLDGLQHPSAAAPILDLANFYCRQDVLPDHPAAPRHSQLAALLGQLVHRMQAIEDRKDEQSQEDVAKTIDDTVALAIGLCDALGQIGEKDHIGKLVQAMDLKHRRIRVVAAASLASLDEECGRKVVIEMAAEPVVRRHAIESADALGFGDQLDPSHRSKFAIAEAKLAFWLAQPSQFGIPPTRMESADTRELFWPGFDSPQEMFLIRFEYQVGEGSFSNVGLSGARVNACSADLTDLPADDIFALFAGCDTDHEDVFEVPVEQWTAAHHDEAEKLRIRFTTSGYENIQPKLLCFFLGQTSLAAIVEKEGRRAVAVADNDGVLSRRFDSAPRQLQAQDVAAIYRGRRILHTFNRDEA